jgi:N-methylhydantoinase B
MSPTKFSGLTVQPGERIVVRLPGGGGWGPAAERPREAVLRDVRDELLTPTSAAELYGVPLEEAEQIVREHGWEHRRAGLRARRAEAQP